MIGGSVSESARQASPSAEGRMNPFSIAFAHYNLRGERALLDELCRFYCDVVGLHVGPRPSFADFGYWLYAGERDVLHLSQLREGETREAGVRSTFDHAAFACSGRALAEARLRRHGVDFRVAEVPGMGLAQLFFNDPAGNGVELSFCADDR